MEWKGIDKYCMRSGNYWISKSFHAKGAKYTAWHKPKSKEQGERLGTRTKLDATQKLCELHQGEQDNEMAA